MPKPAPPARRSTPRADVFGGHSAATIEPPGVKYAKVPEEKVICLKFRPDSGSMDLFDTDIARILLQNDLPVTVIVRETFHSPRSFLSIAKGGLLTLHFIRRPTRVYATDSTDNEFYLPLYAFQMYQVLPMNPVHDDKEFNGTKALINAKPLPQRVRIKEAHYSAHPGEAQEVGDIIEIDRIEKRPVPIDSNNPPQKCVIGTCNGVPLAFSESMKDATYSTMPSIDFLSLSEIVAKFPLPLRVRKADHPEFVMILHRKDIEYHVVATTANLKQVLSVPVTWQGKVEILESANLDKLFRSLLPPLYPLVNTTWGLKEPGRCELQPNVREVARPLGEILEYWSRIKQGQDFILKASQQTVQSYKLRIDELLEEKQRLRNLEQMYAGQYRNAPPVPSRRGAQPPPRPPRISPNPLSSSGTTGSQPSNNTASILQSQQEELQAVLESKQHVVIRLREDLKNAKANNDELKERNASLLRDVSKLEAELDNLQMYSSLDPGYVSVMEGQPIYSTGGDARKDLNSYNIEDVIQLLREMKLEKYEEKFRENMIDGMLLASLTEDELCDELEMNRIPAKRLLIQVQKMRK